VLTFLASAAVLIVLLFVLPAVVILRDLRAGRPDPGWNKDGAI
jgi:hypothetical protein